MTGTTPHPTDFYDEGDTVTLDSIVFRVLHTPGHTPGSVCLIADDVMFSGDTLFAGQLWPYGFSGSSWMQMESSLRKLHDLPVTTLCCPVTWDQALWSGSARPNFFMMQALQG